MSDVQFFHKISNDEYNRLVDEDKTWQHIIDNYKQPDWCGYPEALRGGMGCWKLTDRGVKSQEDCKECELNVLRHEQPTL